MAGRLAQAIGFRTETGAKEVYQSNERITEADSVMKWSSARNAVRNFRATPFKTSDRCRRIQTMPPCDIPHSNYDRRPGRVIGGVMNQWDYSFCPLGVAG